MAEQMKKPSATDLAFNSSSALRIINPYLQRSQSLGAADDDILAAGEVRLRSGPLRPRQTDPAYVEAVDHDRQSQGGLHADVQDQLRHGERVCPFRYLRVHSIFDDEMRVYGEDEADHLRHTDENKWSYAQRKETIERVFAAMNLKKWQPGSGRPVAPLQISFVL
ncbi:hypothetical protein HFN20_04300 [Paenibacillus dendritiformis]|uniref:hypothetical protein n=1 Tax=Paenibacillus dendritiformis TaxID=130049 RepID=UPI00143DFB8C|nr:hypothetical protein [Paenibacillus dendritiformis]